MEKNILVCKSCDICEHQDCTILGADCDLGVEVEENIFVCDQFKLLKWQEPKEEN